jgi:hypothetical protein
MSCHDDRLHAQATAAQDWRRQPADTASIGDVREERIRERLVQGADLFCDGPKDELIE